METIDVAALARDAVTKQASTNPADFVASGKAMQEAIIANTGNKTAAQNAVADANISAADKADILAQETANINKKNTVDVLGLFSTLNTNTQLGIDSATAHLQESVKLREEASQLELTRPNIFTNPIAAITSAWKSTDMQEKANIHEETARSQIVDVNSMLNLGRTRIQDTIAANGLRSQALLEEKAAQLSAGVKQQQIRAESQVNTAAILADASGQLYDVSRTVSNSSQNAEQLNLQRSGQAIQNRRLNNELMIQEREQQKLNDVAMALWRTSNGNLNPTAQDMRAYTSSAEILKKNDPVAYSQLGIAGSIYSKHNDARYANAEINKNAPISTINVIGSLTGDTTKQNFGLEYKQQRAQEIADSVFQQKYVASGSITPFDEWYKKFPDSERKTVLKAAADQANIEMASTTASDYIRYKSGKVPLPNQGLKLVAMETPQSIEQIYKYKVGSKENAFLNSPQVRLALQNADALGGSEQGSFTLSITMYNLAKKAGIKKPEEVVAKFLRAAKSGELTNNDPEFVFARDGGVDITVQAKVKLPNGQYADFGDPQIVKRYSLMRQEDIGTGNVRAEVKAAVNKLNYFSNPNGAVAPTVLNPALAIPNAIELGRKVLEDVSAYKDNKQKQATANAADLKARMEYQQQLLNQVYGANAPKPKTKAEMDAAIIKAGVKHNVDSYDAALEANLRAGGTGTTPAAINPSPGGAVTREQLIQEQSSQINLDWQERLRSGGTGTAEPDLSALEAQRVWWSN